MEGRERGGKGRRLAPHCIGIEATDCIRMYWPVEHEVLYTNTHNYRWEEIML